MCTCSDAVGYRRDHRAVDSEEKCSRACFDSDGRAVDLQDLSSAQVHDARELRDVHRNERGKLHLVDERAAVPIEGSKSTSISESDTGANGAMTLCMTYGQKLMCDAMAIDSTVSEETICMYGSFTTTATSTMRSFRSMTADSQP